jgi:CRISPR-associated protein Csd1
MSALASLVRAYERLEEHGDVPDFGYSRANISFSIRLDKDGKPTCTPIDLREPVEKGKKLVGRRIDVPTFLGQRTSGIDSNFLWDKTQYVLGVHKPDPKKSAIEQVKEASRALLMHKDFVGLHQKHLASETDEGLIAMLRFLENWTPERFDAWPEDMKGENVVFELDGDRRYVHQRPAARELWLKVLEEQPTIEAVCLVGGERSRAPLTHPPIKGVDGAQSSGASIVSYNLDAFTSYGHVQGENAPISEPAAFAYTTALNRFLEKASGHRVQIGDASTVFWADASETDAIIVEGVFGAFTGAETAREDEAIAAQKIAAILETIRLGRPREELEPNLPPGVRFSVLGLSPNAARLSVRFYIEDDFGHIAENFLKFMADLRLDPKPDGPSLSINSILLSIVPASLRKKSIKERMELVPKNWAGEYFQSVLTGNPFPNWIGGCILARLRSDGAIDWIRVSALKGDHVRTLRRSGSLKREGYLVSLDATCQEPGYLLGRLFAVRDQIQWAALGDVGSSLKDKFYSSASTYPERVFAAIERYTAAHLARLRREKPALKVNLERDLASVMELFDPKIGVPKRLDNNQHALLAIGYYHQRQKYLASKEKNFASQAKVEGRE